MLGACAPMVPARSDPADYGGAVSHCPRCGSNVCACCEHAQAPGTCVECAHNENDLLRERVDALCERVAALEAQVEKLDASKCSHMVDKWGDGCENCNDGIRKPD